MAGTDLLPAANDHVHFFPFNLSNMNLRDPFACTVALVFGLK